MKFFVSGVYGSLNTLSNHIENGMFDQVRITRIGDASSQARREFPLPVGLAQKQSARVRCYISAPEIRAENLVQNT